MQLKYNFSLNKTCKITLTLDFYTGGAIYQINTFKKFISVCGDLWKVNDIPKTAPIIVVLIFIVSFLRSTFLFDL